MREEEEKIVQAFLEVVSGPETGRRLYLTHHDLLIGRDPQYAQLVLADPKMARAHCRIFWRGDAWYVVDIGMHGMLVNSSPAGNQPVRLNPGDIMQIGDCVLRLTPAQDAALAPSANQGQPISPLPYDQTQQAIPYYPSNQQGPQQSGQHVHVQVSSNNNVGLIAIAVAIALVGLGPCGILCLGLAFAAILPYLLVVAGVVLMVVGGLQRATYVQQPAHPAASKGTALLLIGLVLALAGLAWILLAYASLQAPSEQPRA